MAPKPPALDIVSLAIALAALLFSPELSAVLGPYWVILTAATLGAAWSASRRPSNPHRFAVLLYVAGMVVLALLVTVPLAELAARMVGVHVHAALAPVALLIGAAGPDWLLARMFSLINRRLGDDQLVDEQRRSGEPRRADHDHHEGAP